MLYGLIIANILFMLIPNGYLSNVTVEKLKSSKKNNDNKNTEEIIIKKIEMDDEII